MFGMNSFRSRPRLFLWTVGRFFLHVRLHRPPQGPDVPLAKARRSPSLNQLQEEGVLCKDGLGEHLQKVSGNIFIIYWRRLYITPHNRAETLGYISSHEKNKQ